MTKVIMLRSPRTLGEVERLNSRSSFPSRQPNDITPIPFDSDPSI